MFGFLGDLFGGGNKKSKTVSEALPPIRLEDYAESNDARKMWADKLKLWSNEPGYGAIAPEWGDIWENARQKVQRYYMGGPEGPGAVAGVRSNLARRGMSENPAAETQISRMGMHQGNTLADIAVKQAIEQAAFGEKGRQTWLASTQNLAGLKPSYMSGGTVTERSSAPQSGGGWDILGQLGANEIMGGDGGGGMDDIGGLLSMFGMGGGYEDLGIGDPTGVSSGSSYDEDFDIEDGLMMAMNIARMFGGDFSGAADTIHRGAKLF